MDPYGPRHPSAESAFGKLCADRPLIRDQPVDRAGITGYSTNLVFTVDKPHPFYSARLAS